MLTNKERTDEMHRRAARLERERRVRIARISGTAGAAISLVLIVAFSVFMSGSGETLRTAAAESMRGSIFSGSGALGYIIVGLLAFILGIAVTVFCFRLKKWQEDEKDSKQEDTDDRDDR